MEYIDMSVTELKKQILTDMMNADPEFKAQMKAYGEMLNEFGAVETPIYLRDKLQDLEDILQARLNSNKLQ
jgi:hypothetical protein